MSVHTGVVRLDRRTKDLCRRLHPGNVAVIDHDDLDLVAAESLLDHGVSVVVNARPSISGRYPNIGPLVLARAGVPLIDDVGDSIFDAVSEGQTVTVRDGEVLLDDQVIAKGKLLGEEEIRSLMDSARARLSETVEAFAENTLEYVRKEQQLLIDGVKLPELKTKISGRYALVIVRGYHYKEDLRLLRGFVREQRPVVIAVDGAADACIAEGIKPDVIVGDCDSVSTSALQCGAEIVVHPQGDWRRRFLAGEQVDDPPEVMRVKALGIEPKLITVSGMSEDVALLLAHEKGAELIVAVGTHTSAIEMLDKGRKGMASTFLVRLRIGPSLVDAKGVSLLYRHSVKRSDLVLIVVAALSAFLLISFVLPPMRLFWSGVFDQFGEFFGGFFG